MSLLRFTVGSGGTPAGVRVFEGATQVQDLTVPVSPSVFEWDITAISGGHTYTFNAHNARGNGPTGTFVLIALPGPVTVVFVP